MAPYLKYNAPTTRENSGGWAQPMTRRIIGLSMLNNLNVTQFNHLPVISFAFPNTVLDGPLGDTATAQYSFRMNTSFAPRSDYLKDVAALPPFLLIAGEEDESFVAQKYQDTMSEVNRQGQYHLLAGVNHLAVVDAAETPGLITGFLTRIQNEAQ